MIQAWKGREVEGRLLGVPSLFFGVVDESVPDALLLVADHVYVNPQTLDGPYGVLIAERALELGRVVTLAVDRSRLDRLPSRLYDACHIVLTLPARHPLKASDEVRLQFDAYHVWTSVYGNGVETRPSAYAADQPLTDAQIHALRPPESPEHIIRTYPAITTISSPPETI